MSGNATGEKSVAGLLYVNIDNGAAYSTSVVDLVCVNTEDSAARTKHPCLNGMIPHVICVSFVSVYLFYARVTCSSPRSPESAFPCSIAIPLAVSRMQLFPTTILQASVPATEVNFRVLLVDVGAPDVHHVPPAICIRTTPLVPQATTQAPLLEDEVL